MALMIISLLQTKGGTGKTTLALCLAYSKAFHSAFGSMCLVELDPQGTLKAWHDQRSTAERPNDNVRFVQLLEANHKRIGNRLKNLVKDHETMILDVPGESVGKFATKFAASLSDIVLLPMRSSTNDEQSFSDNILPIIEQVIAVDPQKKGAFFILPTFVHPQTRPASVKGYFDEVMPKSVTCLSTVLPVRSVYENFSRDGMTLREYAQSVKGNARNSTQVKKAINDIERIANKILKLNQ